MVQWFGTRGTVRRSWIAGGEGGPSRWIRRLHHQRENCRQGSQGSGALSVGKMSGPDDAPEINRTSPRPAGVMPWEWLAGAVPASSPLAFGAGVAEILPWAGTWVLSGVEMRCHQVRMRLRMIRERARTVAVSHDHDNTMTAINGHVP